MNYFEHWTDYVSIYFYPLIPLIIQVAFFWVYGSKNAVADINTGSKHPLSIIDKYILKYIFPSICFIVIILSIIYNGIG